MMVALPARTAEPLPGPTDAENRAICTGTVGEIRKAGFEEINGHVIRLVGSLKGHAIKLDQHTYLHQNLRGSPYRLSCYTMGIERKGSANTQLLLMRGTSVEELFADADGVDFNIEKGVLVQEEPDTSRFAFEGAKKVTQYELDTANKKFKAVRSWQTSTYAETLAAIKGLMTKPTPSKTEEAIKKIHALEKRPDGRTDYTFTILTEVYPLFESSIKSNPKRASELSSALGLGAMTQVADLFKARHQGQVRAVHAQMLNDLGYYLMQAGEVAVPEELFELVLSEFPGRTETHHNLADLYLKSSRKPQALVHFYIYEKQMHAFYPGRKFGLPSGVAKSLRDQPPAPSADELKYFLAFNELTLEGKSYLNFTRPPLLAGPYDDQPARLKLNRPVAVMGIPYDPSEPVSLMKVGEALEPFKLKLAENFTLTGVKFKRGTWIQRTENAGWSGELADDQTVAGYPLKGGTKVCLGLDGKPTSFTALKDLEIQGFKAKAGGKITLTQPKDYSLCGVPTLTLAEPVKAGALTLPADTEVSFVGENLLPEASRIADKRLSLYSDRPLTWQGKSLRGLILAEPGMKIYAGELAEAWTDPQGKLCPAKANWRQTRDAGERCEK